MQWRETGRGVEITDCPDFDLKTSFLCGQCFRWEEEEDGAFFGMVHSHSLRIRREEEKLILEGASSEDFLTLWRDYFDLTFDYSAARRSFCEENPLLNEAAEYASGLRILRQEPWEALCSFILSQNNNIPRIRGIISRLCEAFGEKKEGGFSFPSAERLASLSAEELSPLRCGFRAKYVIDAARKIASGEVSLEALRTLPLEEAQAELMRIDGVGSKVASCTLLYGLHRLDAFPVDVWMRRAMQNLFPGKQPSDFGPYAGLAQQYIFHYSRMHPDLFPKEKGKIAK